MYSAIMTALASAVTVAGSSPAAAAAAATAVPPLRPVLHDMRLVKSEAEIRLMRQSAVVAAAGLERCIRGTRPGVGEWQLAAAFGEDADLAMKSSTCQ